MRALLLLVLLLIAPVATFAQETATTAAESSAASDADIDALVRILENDASRALLIERLQQSAGDAPVAEAPVVGDLSIARQLAEYTRTIVEGTAITFGEIGQLLAEIGQGLAGAGNADFDALRDAAIGVVLIGFALIAGFLVLRVGVTWLQGRMAARVVGRGWPHRVVGALGASALDAGSVVLAWGLGYAVAVGIAGPAGTIGINQSLLLNAFLLVELAKMVVRVVLAPRSEALRLLPASDGNAAYWSFWLSRVIALLGYAFLFVSPVVAASLSANAASGLRLLAVLTAVIIGIVVVLQNKQTVRLRFARWAEGRESAGYGRLLLLMGQYWHLLAIAYLLALLVVWIANPDQALPFMVGATLQSVIAILAGALLVGFISRFVGLGLRLPEDVRQRLPLLEARLVAFVPRVMDVVRSVVVLGVLLAVAQAWTIFDFVGWISTEQGQAIAGSIISALLIIVVCIVAYLVVASWVEFRLNTTAGKVPTPREKTLLNLFKNAFTISLLVFGLMLALAQIGVNIAPLLAGAGVVGLAIGFGAQKLVQDIITGIFIQFENVMNEGDVVEAAGKAGVVEKLTIRSVTIRDMSGTVHLIPFSSVDQVSNMVRGFSFYVAEFEVARDSQIEAVKQAMRDAFVLVMATEHKDVVLDDLDLQGLIAITPASMSLRARIKTLAGKQWGPGRLYSEEVMRLFDERGISTPTQRISYVARPDGRSVPPPGDAG